MLAGALFTRVRRHRVIAVTVVCRGLRLLPRVLRQVLALAAVDLFQRAVLLQGDPLIRAVLLTQAVRLIPAVVLPAVVLPAVVLPAVDPLAADPLAADLQAGVIPATVPIGRI